MVLSATLPELLVKSVKYQHGVRFAMHPVDIEMIQFLTLLVVRDDGKSSGANPDP